MPSRFVQAHQAADQPGEQPHPVADLSLGETKEQPHQILGGIDLVVKEDKIEPPLGEGQGAFAAGAELAVP